MISSFFIKCTNRKPIENPKKVYRCIHEKKIAWAHAEITKDVLEDIALIWGRLRLEISDPILRLIKGNKIQIILTE